MSRSPFDLAFDELVAAGAAATAAAIDQAERAGVPIAAIDPPKSAPRVRGGWTQAREDELRRL